MPDQLNGGAPNGVVGGTGNIDPESIKTATIAAGVVTTAEGLVEKTIEQAGKKMLAQSLGAVAFGINVASTIANYQTGQIGGIHAGFQIAISIVGVVNPLAGAVFGILDFALSSFME